MGTADWIYSHPKPLSNRSPMCADGQLRRFNFIFILRKRPFTLHKHFFYVGLRVNTAYMYQTSCTGIKASF